MDSNETLNIDADIPSEENITHNDSTFHVEYINTTHLLYNDNDDNYKPMEIDLSDLFPCTECDKQFENEQSLRHHMFNYHQSTHPCSNCPEIFKNRRGLANHKRTKHSKGIESKLEQIKSPLALDIQEKIDTTENTFTCKYCGSQFAFKIHLRQHFKKCEKITNSCSECHKVFASKIKLRRHTKIHNKETIYSCVNCKKVFESQEALTDHTEVKKCVELRLDCEICGESFSSRAMAMHKRKHLNDGTNACLKCGGLFEDKALLDSHIKQAHPDHFPCSICDKIYFSKKKLKNHTKIRHSLEKIFCDQCGKEFLTLKSLKDHCAAHHGSSFDCSECSQSFSSHDHLYNHRILEHRGEGNFLCDLCPNVLKSKGNLFYELWADMQISKINL